MTRSEAVKYLKAMKDECNDTCHKVRYVTHEEALDMAIQTLTQECVEPTQKHVGNALDMRCDDSISREDADEIIDWLCRLRSEINAVMDMATVPRQQREKYCDILSKIIEWLIYNMPSVTVRQTDCENCSKCEDAFMRGHDVGLENGYKQGERDARYESVTQSGKWRPVYQGDEIINYRCSECEFGNTFGKSTYRMNFCPNCGAKMVEPQESEDK